MRKIEAQINDRRGERELRSVIPSTNFRGIEIRNFAAEIARLALIIAKFQCDALHIGDLFARKQVLPLDKKIIGSPAATPSASTGCKSARRPGRG